MNKVIKANKEIPKDILEENELSHHGVMGMKWGVRKDRAVISNRKSMIKDRRTLSNRDLKRAIERLKMEKEYKKLAEEDTKPVLTAGKALVATLSGALLGVITKEIATPIIRDLISKAKSG